MVPRLKATHGLSDGELGVFLFLSAVGALGGMAIAPMLNERAPRLALPVCALSIAAALTALGASDGRLWLFATALILVGTTSGLLDIIANARIAQIEAGHDTGLMNLNHGTYSLVYAAAAIATGLARDAELSTLLWFSIIAGAVIALAPLMMLDHSTGPSGTDGGHSARGAVPLVAIFAGIIAMLGFFAENATEHWSALHIERTLGQGAALGALGPAMLGLTMGIGRIAGHFISVRGDEPRLLRLAVTVASGGLLIAATAPVAAVAYLGFALLGLGVSVVAPLALAVAGQSADDTGRAHAVARAAMISYGGFFFGPPVMGFLAEAAGLRAAFAIVAVLLLAVTLALLPRIRLR